MTLLARIFGCPHERLSRVFTMGKPKRSYQVCLDCGRELEYDLAAMRLTGSVSRQPATNNRQLATATRSTTP
jgi:hypothetical protein